MADEYTTLRVKKTTRDLINRMASGKGISVEELLSLFMKSTKDAIKQILIEVDKEKYYTMRDLAQLLHRLKLIQSPKVEDAVMLAMDNLAKGMEKSLRGTQESKPVPDGHSGEASQGGQALPPNGQSGTVLQ